MALLQNSTFVVGISFVLFFALVFYLGVHKTIGAALDARAEKIKAELDEARRLREEAQTVLADFERKQQEVDGLAQGIIDKAKQDAEHAAEEAKAALARSIERRLKAADDQIASAESAAVKAVKDKAVAIAVASAREVIAEKLGQKDRDAMIDTAIKDVGAKLH